MIDTKAFLRWCAEQQLVSHSAARRAMACEVKIGPILALREAIFRVGVAVARRRKPSGDDLDLLLACASKPLPPFKWDGQLRFQFQSPSDARRLLGLIARDAVVLFSSPVSQKIRVCAGDDCGWLFLDESRGKPRRWCSMSDCGNRAKARALYERARARTGRVGLGPRATPKEER